MKGILNPENIFIATLDSRYIRDAQIIPYDSLSSSEIDEYDENLDLFDDIYYHKDWYDLEVNHFLAIIHASNENEALEKVLSRYNYPKSLVKISNANLIL